MLPRGGSSYCIVEGIHPDRPKRRRKDLDFAGF
jgi:hypothetical protein